MYGHLANNIQRKSWSLTSFIITSLYLEHSCKISSIATLSWKSEPFTQLRLCSFLESRMWHYAEKPGPKKVLVSSNITVLHTECDLALSPNQDTFLK